MIPKKIHYCWVGNSPIPENNLKCIESWKKFCPDYEIIRWDESNYDFFKNKYMAQAYNEKKWGFVPDYARLDIIYQHGGIYLDTDVEIVKNLDELLKYDAFFGFDKANHIALGLGFGAVPKNCLMKELMESYDDLKFKYSDGSLNLVPSPVLNTKTIEDLNLFDFDGTLQIKNNIAVFPWQYFDPFEGGKEGKLHKNDNTFTIHWYDASWMDEKQKKYVEIMLKYHKIFGKKLGDIIFWPHSMIFTYGFFGSIKHIVKKLFSNNGGVK